jgi:ribosomal protein S15P/S13E
MPITKQRLRHDLAVVQKAINQLEIHLEPTHRARNFRPRKKLQKLIDRRAEILAVLAKTSIKDELK